MKRILPIVLLAALDLTETWGQSASDSARGYYRQAYHERVDTEERMVDGCKKQFMDLHDNLPYNHMQANFFPSLGSSLPEVSCLGTEPPVEVVPDIPEVKGREEMTRHDITAITRPEVITQPAERLALKTNLLYDALLMPSLEIEYRISDRWTVQVEGDIAWWKNDGKRKYYQVATVSPEGRWWFGQKKGSPWHGHYIGVFGGFTWFDLENKKRGYQGKAETVGVSYGYMFPIGKRLSLEAGIGVGYLHSKYEEYLPADYMGGTHYVYQQTSRLNYFGPLKLKLALVWRLWNDNRKGGGK